LEWVLLGLRILATVILYTFLGLAFYLIWRELKQLESQAAAQPHSPPYQLRVVATTEGQSPAVGETMPLQPVTLLGQTTAVGDDSAAAQARLRQENGVWWLEDLGTSNETMLNDSPLSEPMPLSEGDIIAVGSLRFKLESSP